MIRAPSQGGVGRIAEAVEVEEVSVVLGVPPLQELEELYGDLLIDLERRRVQRGQRRISLTATEFEILRHLASKPGRVFSRRELLELVRDYEALDQDEKTINVHVSHLREKLEDDPSEPVFILTVRGAGYAFAER